MGRKGVGVCCKQREAELLAMKVSCAVLGGGGFLAGRAGGGTNRPKTNASRAGKREGRRFV